MRHYAPCITCCGMLHPMSTKQWWAPPDPVSGGFFLRMFESAHAAQFSIPLPAGELALILSSSDVRTARCSCIVAWLVERKLGRPNVARKLSLKGAV